MTSTSTGYAARLRQAAHEDLDDGDGLVELGAALSGPCDAVAFLPGRTVVAADVDEDWVAAHVPAPQHGPPEARSVELGRFVAALSARLGGVPATVGVLTAAIPRAPMLRGEFADGAAPDGPWAAYRSEVRTLRFTDHGRGGAIDVGRGPDGRWDTTVRPDEGTGVNARQLLAAALTRIPRDGVLFGSAPVHDVGALRTMLGGGFRPVALEVLLLTRPGATGTAVAPAAPGREPAPTDRRPGRLARLFGARAQGR